MRRLLLAIMFLSACGKNDKPPAPTSGSPNAKPETGPGANHPATTGGGSPDEQAAAMFQNVCSQCHGMGGMGDGPAAASLNPKPRNYTDAAWQASVTDDDIKKIILEGGQAVGKSGMMPAQVQLKGKPEIVDGLVKIIRGFGAKK
ncbi:MAG: c-type cytochrome [Polyangiales bacterium]